GRKVGLVCSCTKTQSSLAKRRSRVVPTLRTTIRGIPLVVGRSRPGLLGSLAVSLEGLSVAEVKRLYHVFGVGIVVLRLTRVPFAQLACVRWLTSSVARSLNAVKRWLGE